MKQSSSSGGSAFNSQGLKTAAGLPGLLYPIMNGGIMKPHWITPEYLDELTEEERQEYESREAARLDALYDQMRDRQIEEAETKNVKQSTLKSKE